MSTEVGDCLLNCRNIREPIGRDIVRKQAEVLEVGLECVHPARLAAQTRSKKCEVRLVCPHIDNHVTRPELYQPEYVGRRGFVRRAK